MKFLIRVDAGGKIGLGHFYRTLLVAKTLHENGHKITFIHLDSDFWREIEHPEFEYSSFCLNRGNEESQMLDLIEKEGFDVFYVDGIINFTEGFISQVQKNSIVVYYQNLSSSKHLCDIFFLPSLHQSNDFFKDFSSVSKVFQGLEFFTFHPIIRKLQPKKSLHSEVKSIAIFAGGSDPNDMLLQLYKWIDYSLFPSITFVFYYGSDYLHKNRIPTELPATTKFKLFDHKDILERDVLVSTFGVSTYEFLYLGMPILSFGHQTSNANASDYLCRHKKVLWSLGELNNPKMLNESIRKISSDYEARLRMVAKAQSNLDLEGAKRIVEILENFKKNEIR